MREVKNVKWWSLSFNTIYPQSRFHFCWGETRKSRSYQEKEYKNRVKGRRLLFAANIKIETEMEEREK